MSNRKLAIGIDIGGTRTKIGLVDIKLGKVVKMLIAPTEKKYPIRFIDNIHNTLNNLLRVSSTNRDEIEGIGIGVPGFVFENGAVDSTYGFLEFMEDYPLVDLVQEQCLLTCRIDNDARMVALGEAVYGKAKAYSRVLVLTLGTGLGLGFVVDKKLDGRLPYSHMGGHMGICENGITCYCGKEGCLESLVSATGIVDAAVRSGWQIKYPAAVLDAETIFTTALNGNADAEKIVFEMIGHLQKGIDNYINIYAPDVIVVGGGVSKGMQPYLPMLNTGQFLKPFKNYKVAVLLSTLHEHSGILGSAALFNDFTESNIKKSHVV